MLGDPTPTPEPVYVYDATYLQLGQPLFGGTGNLLAYAGGTGTTHVRDMNFAFSDNRLLMTYGWDAGLAKEYLTFPAHSAGNYSISFEIPYDIAPYIAASYSLSTDPVVGSTQFLNLPWLNNGSLGNGLQSYNTVAGGIHQAWFAQAYMTIPDSTTTCRIIMSNLATTSTLAASTQINIIKLS